MANNLLKAGHQLIVYRDIVRGSVDDVVANGGARRVLLEVASKSEIVITMLPDGPTLKLSCWANPAFWRERAGAASGG